MKILKVEKCGEGYNVHTDTDMICYLHLPHEIAGLKKDGWIKEPKTIKPLKTRKK